MNRERARELLPIIQAFADGEDIQCCTDGIVWSDSMYPMWRPYEEYRIKPKPREGWVLRGTLYEQPAKMYPDDWIKVREIVD